MNALDYRERRRLIVMDLAGAIGEPRTVNAFTHPDAFCPCVKTHVPSVITFHQHHILPLGMGGPDTPENLILLCPTQHLAIHHLLRELVRTDGEPELDLRRFGALGRTLAYRGWNEWLEAEAA